MKACPSCPNRHQADTLDALAGAAEGIRALRPLAPVLRERAAAIREAGCNWWWSVQYKHDDTGQVKTVELCGREALPRSIEDYAKEIKVSAQTIQEDRTEQKRAMDTIREAADVLGLNEAVGHLAALGFQSAVAKQLEDRRERSALESGETEGS